MSYPVQSSEGTNLTIASELIDGEHNPKFAYDSKIITTQSAGVTTTLYSADQTVGTLFTFQNASRKAGMGGIIQTATLICNVGIVGNYRLMLFDQTVTTTDHSTTGISNADLAKSIGFFDFNNNIDTTTNFITTANGLGIIYQTINTKDIYGVLMTTTSVTLTGITATGITIRLGCSLD